jgi:hypothetical protein
MLGESRISRESHHRHQPILSLLAAPGHMYMRWFIPFVGEEGDTIAEQPKQRWHGLTSSAIYRMPLVVVRLPAFMQGKRGLAAVAAIAGRLQIFQHRFATVGPRHNMVNLQPHIRRDRRRCAAQAAAETVATKD